MAGEYSSLRMRSRALGSPELLRFTTSRHGFCNHIRIHRAKSKLNKDSLYKIDKLPLGSRIVLILVSSIASFGFKMLFEYPS